MRRREQRPTLTLTSSNAADLTRLRRIRCRWRRRPLPPPRRLLLLRRGCSSAGSRAARQAPERHHTGPLTTAMTETRRSGASPLSLAQQRTHLLPRQPRQRRATRSRAGLPAHVGANTFLKAAVAAAAAGKSAAVSAVSRRFHSSQRTPRLLNAPPPSAPRNAHAGASLDLSRAQYVYELTKRLCDASADAALPSYLPSAASELALARTMSAFCAAAAFSFLPFQTRSTVCCSARP